MTMNWDDWEKQYLQGGTAPAPTTGAKPATTTTGSFAQQAAADKAAQQLATGNYHPQLPAGYRELPGGVKALGPNNTAMQKDVSTNLWYPTFVTAADSKVLASQMMAQGQVNRTAPGLATTAPESRAYAGNAGLPGTLAPSQGPQIGNFGSQWIQPGVGFPTGNNATINGVERGLNSMTAGRQGSMTQFPVAPGFRGERDVGNSINFAAGNTANGSLEPQMLFGPMSVTPQTAVPGSYQYGLGNVGDSNRAYSVPFNIGPAGAGLMNIGGNNVQISSADRGTGYGFALNPSPASSVFAATGRNPSEDPASQAAQTLALNSAIAQFGGGPGALTMVNAANGNQFSGYHAGTNNGYFSGNGGSGQGTYWGNYSPTAAAPPATSPATTPTAPVAPVYGPAVTSTGPYGPAFANDQQAAAAYAARGAPGGAIGGTIAATIPTGGAPAAGGGLTQDQLDAMAAAYGYAGGNYGTFGGGAGGAGNYGGGYGDYSLATFAGGGRV